MPCVGATVAPSTPLWAPPTAGYVCSPSMLNAPFLPREIEIVPPG
jgi:hypothetical protein